MIELKIKELLEQYFSNISNWETKQIYFHDNYQLESIKFDFETFNDLFNIYVIEKEIKNICNKYSNYYIEPEIKIFEETLQIKFRYFTRVKQ